MKPEADSLRWVNAINCNQTDEEKREETNYKYQI